MRVVKLPWMRSGVRFKALLPVVFACIAIIVLLLSCDGIFPKTPQAPSQGSAWRPIEPENGGGNSGGLARWTGNEGTWYQIFPISWYDTNGDSKGDLKGITVKLDYLGCLPEVCDFNPNTNPPIDCYKSLHVNGVWLTPIMTGTSYHKYDTEDYMDIDKDFGTLADMEALRDECRKRGIKIN